MEHPSVSAPRFAVGWLTAPSRTPPKTSRRPTRSRNSPGWFKVVMRHGAFHGATAIIECTVKPLALAMGI